MCTLARLCENAETAAAKAFPQGKDAMIEAALAAAEDDLAEVNAVTAADTKMFIISHVHNMHTLMSAGVKNITPH